MNASPELNMWGAALSLLIKDGIFWVSDKGLKHEHHKEAFEDLCFCGESTRHLCEILGCDPTWVSLKFRQYVQKKSN